MAEAEEPAVARSVFASTATIQYVAPFVLFVVLLFAGQQLSPDQKWEAPLRVLVLGVICVLCWPRNLSTLPAHPLLSSALGAAVFLLWIAPDLIDASYRHGPLLSNSIFGHVHSSASPASLQSNWFLFWRSARAIMIVPLVEELFWRGWLMRWLVNPDFEKVPLGAFTPLAFWGTAVLFASEHGPYWDVGLITGIIYNWWLVRCKSLADCVLMHAVTNGLLSGYVIACKQWQYWQ